MTGDSNRQRFVNRYRQNTLHGHDPAPGRKWNQPDTTPGPDKKKKTQPGKRQRKRQQEARERYSPEEPEDLGTPVLPPEIAKLLGLEVEDE